MHHSIDAPKLTEIIIGDRDLKEDSNSFSKVEVLNIECTLNSSI